MLDRTVPICDLATYSCVRRIPNGVPPVYLYCKYSRNRLTAKDADSWSLNASPMLRCADTFQEQANIIAYIEEVCNTLRPHSATVECDPVISRPSYLLPSDLAISLGFCYDFCPFFEKGSVMYV